MDNREFDIFDIIQNKIAKKDIEFFTHLESWQINKLSPLLIMKWMGASNNKEQIKCINDIVNPTVFSLYKDPQLLFKLLMISYKGGKLTWKTRPKKLKDNSILAIISEYYECTLTEAEKYLAILENNDILEIAESLGTDKEMITKLKKHLNARK